MVVTQTVGQNLVPNGGFEQFAKCPGSYFKFGEFNLPGWSSPNGGSPDHFNTCSVGEAGVPHNWAGVSESFEGEGFAGLFLWMGIRQYREYLQSRLTEPLIKDSTYHVEFRYKLSSYSGYALDRIGLAIGDSAVNVSHDNVLPIQPLVSDVRDSAFTRRTGSWEKASMKYKAKGGEQFLIIGNFWDDQQGGRYKFQYRPSPEPMLTKASYYYIDDVQVIPEFILRAQEQLLAEKIPVFDGEGTALNKNYVLRDIQFKFDSYQLLPRSFETLDMLADFLRQNPQLRVQLFGHTDDQGEDQYNLKLSRDRAAAVASYLSSLGIDRTRLETLGVGERRPLINETTEQARAINRRVEIRFIR